LYSRLEAQPKNVVAFKKNMHYFFRSRKTLKKSENIIDYNIRERNV